MGRRKQIRVTDILFQKEEVKRIEIDKLNKNKGSVFFNNVNIGVRKISILKPLNSNGFEDDLNTSKLAKFLAKESINKLSFIINRWSEEYIDENGVKQQMCLKGEPMEALKECLRGFTIMFLALPDWYGYTQEESNLLSNRVSEILYRSKNTLMQSSIANGDKSDLIADVRKRTRTKEEQEVINETVSMQVLIAYDVTLTMSVYFKALGLLLSECEVNDEFESLYNTCAMALTTYVEYVDSEILFMDRYNKIVYGIEPKKTEEEIEREIERSYLIE